MALHTLPQQMQQQWSDIARWLQDLSCPVEVEDAPHVLWMACPVRSSLLQWLLSALHPSLAPKEDSEEGEMTRSHRLLQAMTTIGLCTAEDSELVQAFVFKGGGGAEAQIAFLHRITRFVYDANRFSRARDTNINDIDSLKASAKNEKDTTTAIASRLALTVALNSKEVFSVRSGIFDEFPLLPAHILSGEAAVPPMQQLKEREGRARETELLLNARISSLLEQLQSLRSTIAQQIGDICFGLSLQQTCNRSESAKDKEDQESNEGETEREIHEEEKHTNSEARKSGKDTEHFLRDEDDAEERCSNQDDDRDWKRSFEISAVEMEGYKEAVAQFKHVGERFLSLYDTELSSWVEKSTTTDSNQQAFDDIGAKATVLMSQLNDLCEVLQAFLQIRRSHDTLWTAANTEMLSSVITTEDMQALQSSIAVIKDTISRVREEGRSATA